MAQILADLPLEQEHIAENTEFAALVSRGESHRSRRRRCGERGGKARVAECVHAAREKSLADADAQRDADREQREARRLSKSKARK